MWLWRAGPSENAATIKEQLAKTERLRAVGAAEIDLSRVNPNRVRHLAGLGRRTNPQALARLADDRRHQILAATVVVNRSGRHTLRLPTHWPWTDTFTSLLTAMRARPGPAR